MFCERTRSKLNFLCKSSPRESANKHIASHRRRPIILSTNFARCRKRSVESRKKNTQIFALFVFFFLRIFPKSGNRLLEGIRQFVVAYCVSEFFRIMLVTTYATFNNTMLTKVSISHSTNNSNTPSRRRRRKQINFTYVALCDFSTLTRLT